MTLFRKQYRLYIGDISYICWGFEMRGIIVITFLLVTYVFLVSGTEREYYKVELMNFNSEFKENGASISSDNLSLYFHSTRSGYVGGEDLFVVKRNSENEPWGKPENLGAAVNSPRNEWSPCISNDGLSLYFSSDRPGGIGGYDIWVAKRENINKPWQQAENLGNTVNSYYSDSDPSISTDNLTLYFSDYVAGPERPGGTGNADIWMTKRKSVHDPWEKPVNLGNKINTPGIEVYPFISSDNLYLFFSSDREGGLGNRDIWFSTRTSVNDEWSIPRNIGPMANSKYNEPSFAVSSDGKDLYFSSTGRPEGMNDSMDIYHVRMPVGKTVFDILKMQ